MPTVIRCLPIIHDPRMKGWTKQCWSIRLVSLMTNRTSWNSL
jgi:hypothetical protein